MRKFSKNAIVIVGNGFDLAHGMPTSYNEFANHYLEIVVETYLKNTKSNILISTFRDNNYFKKKFILSVNEWFKKFSIDKNKKPSPNTSKLSVQYISYYFASNIYFSFELNEEEVKLNIVNFLKDNNAIIHLIINNHFLGKLYNNDYKNWFDIERAYFSELKTYSELKDLDRVTILNKEFNKIKKALKKYLEGIKVSKNQNISSFFENSFTKKNNICIINFNYTETIYQYQNHFFNASQRNAIINHIHGDLKNEIIFGYGDDTSNDYENLKNLDEDEYLSNFKTFSYLMKKDYSDLMNTIEDFKDFEVYILGHSLGRTDKTLLKEVFDNNKCLNIHLFKRFDLDLESDKKKEFSALTMNVSRIIDGENSLRNKVIPFEQSINFPTNNSIELREHYKKLYGKNLRKAPQILITAHH